MSGGEVALFDREPSLGYPTAEPSLRTIVARYYGAHFPADEAAQFANQYFAALAPTPPAAASEVVREATALVWKLWGQFYDKRPPGDPKDTARELIAIIGRLATLPPAQPEVDPDALTGCADDQGLFAQDDPDEAAHEYVDDYVMSTDGADYDPSKFERSLIRDALAGFIAEHWPRSTPTATHNAEALRKAARAVVQDAEEYGILDSRAVTLAMRTQPLRDLRSALDSAEVK